MSDDLDELKRRVSVLERQMSAYQGRGAAYRCIRKRASRRIWGLPLYDIALGPDPDTGEYRGHALGVLAIGDIATGVFAIGGVARGVIAFGGIGVGLVLGIGGLGIGLIALGGMSLGGIAVGGLAMGVVAMGGAAWGYYALGGSALGVHVISVNTFVHDAEAVRFFLAWIPGLRRWLPAF